MAGTREYVRLDRGGVTLVVMLAKGIGADCIYAGTSLPAGEDLAALALSTRRGRHESQPDIPASPGLLPQRRRGWAATPAIEASRGGIRLESDFRIANWSCADGVLMINFSDALSHLDVELQWELSEEGVLSSRLLIRNSSTGPVHLERAASLAFPIPNRFGEMTSFAGRWASEMHASKRPIAPEGFARSSAIGKPGFGGGNWLLLHDPETGEALGTHLAWSGDYDTRIDCDTQGSGDGRAVLQMGACWDSGEIVLGPDEYFEAPLAILALASNENALTQRFHAYFRGEVIAFDPAKRPRKVHLNSWEALGFDLSEDKLKRLIEAAAGLGIERFVLDDGWFGSPGKGRRNDRTSLGDWTVCPDILPAGLDPLIEHVHASGMDFGLWVEPEMVSPDSDLYRKHPDWCIHVEGLPRETMRNQLVLDLTRPEVRDNLYAQLDLLLSSHQIAYLKWDHNRDLFPLAGRSHAQTQALYSLLKRLGKAFPEVEIETCSSGGGRIDAKILAHTDRCWPSDNNDPIMRVRIMQAWSRFLPLEVLGNHVGPSPNPITGRQTEMDFRAKIALFGHMGVEADPAVMSAAERDVLAAHIALYKDWRATLHSGQLYRLEHPDTAIFAQIVVGKDRALAIAAQTKFSGNFDAAPIRLKGLKPTSQYRVWLPQPWPAKATLYLPDWQSWKTGMILSGTALMQQGLALPLTHPQTAWLIAIEELGEPAS
ncbi:MAG: alpha-galactosidase [Pseudomonadota bacterium]